MVDRPDKRKRDEHAFEIHDHDELLAFLLTHVVVCDVNQRGVDYMTAFRTRGQSGIVVLYVQNKFSDHDGSSSGSVTLEHLRSTWDTVRSIQRMLPQVHQHHPFVVYHCRRKHPFTAELRAHLDDTSRPESKCTVLMDAAASEQYFGPSLTDLMRVRPAMFHVRPDARPVRTRRCGWCTATDHTQAGCSKKLAAVTAIEKLPLVKPRSTSFVNTILTSALRNARKGITPPNLDAHTIKRAMRGKRRDLVGMIDTVMRARKMDAAQVPPGAGAMQLVRVLLPHVQAVL